MRGRSRVLVTGAAGGIGRAVVRHLIDHGWDVRAIDRAVDPDAPRAVRWHNGGVADAAVARQAVEGIDAVVHLAAIPNPGRVPDLELLHHNSAATFAILDAAGRAGVARAVIASSVSIYGLVYAGVELTPPELPLTERSALQVADAYALTKQVDEACADMMHRRHGIDILALRFPYTTIGREIAARGAALADDPLAARRELWGYLDVEDAALAARLALEADTTGSQPLLVVAPDALGDVDVARLATRLWPGTTCRVAPGAAGYATDLAERLIGFRATRRWNDARA